MTKALDSIPVGHFVEMKGPIGKFEYVAPGRCTVNAKPRSVKRFYMICGGSGITPIFQVLRAVMLDPLDATRCVVLNGNRLLEDILCKDDLDMFADQNPERCRIVHTLTKAPEEWTGRRGRIDKELLAEWCEGRNDGESMVLVCGPEALEASVRGVLKGMGWADEDVLFF